MGALAICTITALVAQQGSNLGRLIKGLTWTALGYMGLNFVIGYVLFIMMSVQEPGIGTDQWRYLELLAEIDPFETPWYLALLIYSAVASACLGSAEMLSLRNQEQTAQPPLPKAVVPPPPPATRESESAVLLDS
jgi:hypothetical protein